jgi:membrane protein required for colicin V production
VVVAFLFFAWLVPDRSQPEWIRSAKSRVVLQGTGDWLMSMLPDDPESTILKRLKRQKPEDQEPPDSDQRPSSPAPARATAPAPVAPATPPAAAPSRPMQDVIKSAPTGN